MPRSFGPYLPAWEGSDAATCSAATDPASLLGRAPALPLAPRPQTRLLAREGSDAATWPTALDLASILGRPPALPRAPWLRTLLPYSGGLRRCHVPRGSGPSLTAREGSNTATCPTALNGPRASGIKKGLAGLGMQLGLRVFKACSRVTEALTRRAGRRRHHDLQTVQTGATVPHYSTTPTQLITPRHGYNGDATRQDYTTLLTEFSTVGRQD
jgi:hypothetical protein